MTDTIIATATIATIIINFPVKETGAGCTGGDGTGDSEGGVGVGAVGVGAGAVDVTSTALFSLVIAIREKHFVSA